MDRHWDRRCYYCLSCEKWFPQTNFWEERPARLGLGPTSLSRHNYRVILNVASGNYDEPAGSDCPWKWGRRYYRILEILHTYPCRYSGNCWDAKQPAELSCTNHSSTSAYTYRHKSLRSCDVYKSFSRPVLFKTAVKGTIKVGGPSAAEGAPRGSPVASKTRGGELVIKPRRALATTTSGAMRFLEHGIERLCILTPRPAIKLIATD